MTYGPNAAGLHAYRDVGAYGQVAGANPHELIKALFGAALDRIAAARGCMERGEIPRKGEHVSKAIAIVGALNGSLDLERGGEIAANLRDLYDYANRRLLLANLHNDPDILDEVAGLLREIKTAWDALPQPQPAQGTATP